VPTDERAILRQVHFFGSTLKATRFKLRKQEVTVAFQETMGQPGATLTQLLALWKD